MNPVPRRVPVASDVERAVTRQAVRRTPLGADFGPDRRTKPVTAAGELARNTLVHGGGGCVATEEVLHEGDAGTATRVGDLFPCDITRIHDARAAAEAGPDPLRCASAAPVATEPATDVLEHVGGGQVLIRTVPHPAARPAPCTRVVQIPAPERSGRFPTRHPVGAGGPHIPLGAAAASGDATSRHSAASGITLVPADAPGHGEAAADAVRTPYHPELPPHSLSHIVEEVLRGSRGAAVAGAHVDTGVQLSTFADTGDIGARPRTKGRRESLVSRPGVAGLHQHSRPAVSQKPPRTQDAVLVLHSDGLPSRRRYPEDSALDRPAPAMTAAVVLRDTLSPANPVRDDTTLAVAAAGSPDPREQR